MSIGEKSACKDREVYIKEICLDVEMAGMQNKTRAVYEGVRKITGKHAPQVKSVKDNNGTILTDPEGVTRWKEYFDKLYNDPNDTLEDILKDFPDAGNREPIPSTEEDEVKAAISRMKQRKSPEVDDITVEEIAAATQDMGSKVIHRLCVWENKELPSQWKKSVIIPLHKKKDKMDCSNYRRICLLYQTSKIFSSILLQRIKTRTEEILSVILISGRLLTVYGGKDCGT